MKIVKIQSQKLSKQFVRFCSLVGSGWFDFVRDGGEEVREEVRGLLDLRGVGL